MQISIRVLLAIVAFIALGTAAVLSGGFSSPLFLATVFIASSAILINSFVATGRTKAMSIGFAIPIALYAGALAFCGDREFVRDSGNFPTTKLFGFVYEFAYDPIYTDIRTGKVVPNYDPSTAPTFGGPTITGGVAMTDKYPDWSEFMEIAHGIAVLVFGSFGALYAGWLFGRQERSGG